MNQQSHAQKNRLFALGGLGVALVIAILLSPFASKDPDGLDRVAQDLAFESKAHETSIAHKLPSASIFDEYALRGVPEALATPLAGLVGTMVTFGLAWGLGKVVVPHRGGENVNHSHED
jgi:cobalt/nickel transport protein